MTGIVGLIWLTGAAVVGLVLGLAVIAAEEVGRRRNKQGRLKTRKRQIFDLTRRTCKENGDFLI